MAVRKSWLTRIREAKARGGFTQDDVFRANSWGSCAVGESVARVAGLDRALIQPTISAASYQLAFRLKDEDKLDEKGMDFMAAVQEDRVEDAERLYREIRGEVKKIPQEKVRGVVAETFPGMGIGKSRNLSYC